MVRAPDCGSGGCGFESRHPPHPQEVIVFQRVDLATVARLGHLRGGRADTRRRVANRRECCSRRDLVTTARQHLIVLRAIAAAACAGAILAAGNAPCAAQGTPGAGTGSTRVTVSGSVRTRVETWDWFGSEPHGRYTYPASLIRLSAAGSRTAWDWQVEFAAPILLALPREATLAAPKGALGMGANYAAANGGHRHAAGLFPKQAFIRIKSLGGRPGQSLTIGRQEFVDGTEVSPADDTLAALKRDRVAHRLVGHFGFTHVGRSLDGARYVTGSSRWNATVLGARATRGVFDVNGWGDANVDLLYGALTSSGGGRPQRGEWRLFYLGYRDERDNVTKVDNRPPPVRGADTDAILLSTVGGHYLRTAPTSAGTLDALLWGALQHGSWGTLRHRAGAMALEGGWQPRGPSKLRPWVRAGFNYASDNADPSDDRHGTFFQGLPTPRVYARFPFFNLMNVDDRFAELRLRPSRRIAVRTDVHALSLSAPADLWYVGGGAFEPDTFGFAARPSGGARSLATLVDASLEATLTGRTALSAYYGHASGGGVTDASFAIGSQAHFAYVELLVRF
jgi:hypothetical protein